MARYAAGESACSLAREYGTRHQLIVAAARAAGTYRDSQTKKHEIAQISAAQWWELYWSPSSQYPSMGMLAKRFSTGTGCVAQYLRLAGITVRTIRQQAVLDYRFGRRERNTPDNSRGDASPLLLWNKNHPPVKGLPRPYQRRSVTCLCFWCGIPITRIPSNLPRTCSVRCGAYLRHWRRRFPGAPRPLILERIAEQLSPLGMSVTLAVDDVARIGRQFGATEAEVLAAYEQRVRGRSSSPAPPP